MALQGLRMHIQPVGARLGASTRATQCRRELSSLAQLCSSPGSGPTLLPRPSSSMGVTPISLSLAASCTGRARAHQPGDSRPDSGIRVHTCGHGSLESSVSPAHVASPSRRGASTVTRAVATPATIDSGFDEMVTGTARKYYMVGGKGGVGKTSISASLGVKFAAAGQPTLVVSTDPAHSLSDSFAQDVTGGKPVPIDGADGLYAMEIDPEQAREEFRMATAGEDGASGVKDFMDSMGLGSWLEQLSELKLGELLDTPPPGLDEAVAIAKVVQFIQADEYSKFTRIIFDTAPTGHTLRLLSLPDFLDASIGKILKLKAKITSATSAVKSIFGQQDGKPDKAVDKLEQLKERMGMVRDIFRNQESTEFVIVTIPTVMAISESSRLLKSLEVEGVPAKRLVVNQILPASTSDCKFCNIKRKDQQRAVELVRSDPELGHLKVIEAPLFDLEIRGVPALQFMGSVVWK